MLLYCPRTRDDDIVEVHLSPLKLLHYKLFDECIEREGKGRKGCH